jgi:hypothetical protein
MVNLKNDQIKPVMSAMKTAMIRMAIADIIEGKSCVGCGHTYESIDDAIDRKVVAVTRGGTTVACSACYAKLPPEAKSL